MKTIVLLGIMLVSNAAFAATDCRVVEYPDHYEAVCTGDAPQPSATSPSQEPSASPAAVTSSAPRPAPAQEQAQPQEHFEQTFDALLAAEEQAQQASDDGDVTVVISELGRRHVEQWLKTQPH